MKHMISQTRPGSTNESLFWHNYKKMYYFDSLLDTATWPCQVKECKIVSEPSLLTGWLAGWLAG